MNFSIDKAANKITVEREYAAPLQAVWNAWTQRELLDQWWAPKPWKAETKSLNFSEGGHWLYAMVGPQGERHWARFDFTSIESPVSFSGKDAFCDEEGNVNNDLPRSGWTNTFFGSGEKTRIVVTISLESAADLEKMLETGFQEGFTMGLNNLEALLAAQSA